MASALDDYFSALLAACRDATGSTPDGGTLVAPETDREGTGTATSYPTPSGTIVWCDPARVSELDAMLSDVRADAIDTDDFVARALADGAELLGCGHNRVLNGGLIRPHVDLDALGLRAQVVDPGVAQDRGALESFVEASSDDDLDEADLDLEELDPLIVGVFDGPSIVAYGSGRPSEIDENFDDIGVLTHPDHRRRGLGALAVAEFVDQRLRGEPQRRMLYRCNVENSGSNGVAETLGFTLANTIGAVRFP